MVSIPQASAAQRAYIAGYTDAEACLSYHNHTPVLAYESCHPAPIRSIAKLFGGEVRTRKRTGEKQTKRTVFTLKYYGDNCCTILKILLPYLIEKQDQADAILNIRKLKTKLREAKTKNHK